MTQLSATDIADEVRQQIDTGVLRFHEHLPDAATIAEQWRVPRSVARRALAILRDEFLIDSMRRVTQPDWERARREANARRRAGLPIAGDRPAAGDEIRCSLGQCRNLAVVVLRPQSQRLQVRPRVSCSKHRDEVRRLMRVGDLFVPIFYEFFQDPYERPSTKRKALGQ